MRSNLANTTITFDNVPVDPGAMPIFPINYVSGDRDEIAVYFYNHRNKRIDTMTFQSDSIYIPLGPVIDELDRSDVMNIVMNRAKPNNSYSMVTVERRGLFGAAMFVKSK